MQNIIMKRKELCKIKKNEFLDKIDNEIYQSLKYLRSKVIRNFRRFYSNLVVHTKTSK